MGLIRKAAFTAGALAYGVSAAFLLVFRTLYTDGPADAFHPEYLMAHALTFLAFLVPALLLSWRVRSKPGWWAVWLGAPGLAVLLLYLDAGLGVRVLTGTALVLGLGVGEWIGGGLRDPTRPALPPSED